MNFDFRNWDIHVGTPHPFNAERARPNNGTGRPDPSRFYTRETWEAEWENMFTKTWLLAGVESDIPDEGDWLRFEIGPESFVVVRQGDGSVKAFYNVCPHRGSQIALTDFGSANSFVCPFHSWKFDLEGKNVEITDEETFNPDVLCHGTDLSEVKCDTAAGLVFISMNDDVQPLSEFLGEVADHLGLYDIDQMVAVQHKKSDWAANWKGGVDAFYEIYHLHSVHPQTQAVMDDRTQIDLFPNGMSRQFVPFAQPSPRFPDQETVNEGIKMMLADAGIDPEASLERRRKAAPLSSRPSARGLTNTGLVMRNSVTRSSAIPPSTACSPISRSAAIRRPCSFTASCLIIKTRSSSLTKPSSCSSRKIFRATSPLHGWALPPMLIAAG